MGTFHIVRVFIFRIFHKVRVCKHQGWDRLPRHNYDYTMITKNDYNYNYDYEAMITCSNEMFLKQILLSNIRIRKWKWTITPYKHQQSCNHLSVVTTFIQLILNKSCVLNNTSPSACEIMNKTKHKTFHDYRRLQVITEHDYKYIKFGESVNTIDYDHNPNQSQPW